MTLTDAAARETPIPTPPKGGHPRQGVSGRGALSGCRGCGDPKDHDGRAGQRLACVSMAWERTWAIEWLAGATGMPVAEAERAVDAMRRTAGIRAGVRALDALLDLGWRPGGGR